MFAEDDVSKFLLVPIFHIVLLFFLLLLFSSVLVQVLLGHFLADFEVMAKLALPSFVTVTLLEKLTQHSLWIDAKGDFLDLDGLEEFGSLGLCLLGGRFFFRSLFLLSLFSLLFGGLVGFCLSLELGDLSLCGAAFFVFHAKGFVLDGGFGLFGLVGAFHLGRHVDEKIRAVTEIEKYWGAGRGISRRMSFGHRPRNAKSRKKKWTVRSRKP